MILIMAVSLYTVRIVLKSLGTVDYGIYTAIGGLVTTLSFLSTVLSNASQRFLSITIANDYKKLSNVFSSLVYTYAIVVFLIIILLEILGLWFLNNQMTIPIERLEAANVIFHFSVVTFAITILANPLQALIIAHEDMNWYACISIIEVFLKLVCVFLLTCLNYDKLITYSFLILIICIFIGVSYFIVCRLKYKDVRLLFSWQPSMFKSIFNYSSWTLFGGLAGIANTQGLNLLLNVFFGPIVNAAYAIGNQVSIAVSSFASSFFMAIRPPMTKNYASKKLDDTLKLFLFSSKALFFLVLIIVLPLFVEAPSILKLWLGEVGEHMISFVRLMLVYTFVLCQNSPLTTIAESDGAVKKYHGIVDGFTMLTLPIVYILFHFIGMPEVSIFVSIIVFVIAHFIRILIVCPMLGVGIKRYFVDILMPCVIPLILSIIFIFIFQYFRLEDFFLNLLIKVILYESVLCLSFFYIALSKQERMSLLQLIRKK